MSAPEIVVLRVIHGDDAVVDIERTNTDLAATDDTERNRLQIVYGGALSKIDGVKSIKGVFGVAGALPKEIEGAKDAPKAKKKAAPKKRAPRTTATKAQTATTSLADLETV